MSNPALNKRTTPSGWQPKFPFDLLIAYEDRETRNRALHLYDHLAQHLMDDCDFQCSWWKMDHLSDPTLRQEAANSATEANMVVLSLRTNSRLDGAQQQWIEDWTSRRPHRKSAFVVMVAGTDFPERDAAPLTMRLRDCARRAGMDFFPHGFKLNPPNEKSDLQPLIDLSPRITPVPPLANEILQYRNAYPRWGINE